MARLARLVIPGMPYHVTQRGNRRQQTFFNDGDYAAYPELMADWCREEGVDVWGYCLMPNHVHSIAVPRAEQSLRLAIGEAHRRYTRRINFREKWRGYLWQGRFASFVMDDWKAFLNSALPEGELRELREHGRTGRPLGSPTFLDRLETMVGRVLKPLKRGPKPKPSTSREGNAAN